MNIKRRISHTKGLQTELDLRIGRVADLVTDLSTIDGTPGFDDKYIGANAFKTADALNAKYTDIVAIGDVLDTADFDTKLISARELKALKELIDAAATGLVFKGAFDIGTEVAFPASPATGWFYKITNSTDVVDTPKVSVDVGGINLTAGDSLFYDGTGWFKIDSTEAQDILRDGDISKNADFSIDPLKLTDRETIEGYVESVRVKFINESLTVASDGATLTNEPLNGVIFTGVASVNNGDGTFDLVECSVTGTALTITPDVPGEYDGKNIKVTYAFV